VAGELLFRLAARHVTLLHSVLGLARIEEISAAEREVDLHPDVAELLHRYTAGKPGLWFHTARCTPHLYNKLEDRWLTPRLTKMGLQEEGMGWHSFKRYRKTWLRGARCLEDLNNFWMLTNHKRCPIRALLASPRGTRNAPRRGRASRIWLRVAEDRSCSKCSKNIRHEIGG
jgi:hypothetical protein